MASAFSQRSLKPSLGSHPVQLNPSSWNLSAMLLDRSLPHLVARIFPQFVCSTSCLNSKLICRVSAAPFVGLTGTIPGGNHVLMMVDPDAVLSANGTKTTIMHFFQTDLNITIQASNYSRLAAPTIVPAFESYLKPSPPAGQIHRYTLLLFVHPVTLTKDIVSSAFSTVFAQSGLGVDRAGFDIFQSSRG